MEKTGKGPRTGRSVSFSVVFGTALLAPGLAFAQANELRMAIPDIPTQLGNPYISTALTSPAIFFLGAIYDGLTIVGADGNTAPRIASAWKNVDKDTWQFTIRSGTTFANGKPLNAAAIAANINDMLLGDYAKWQQIFPLIPSPESARVIDTNTVEIRTKKPAPIFDKEIGGLPIAEPGAWKDLGVENYAKNPVGTGPFKVEPGTSWAGGIMRLPAHTGSWHAPKVPMVVMNAIPERQARVNAIESGQVDVAVGLNMDAYDTVIKAGRNIYTAAAPVVYAVPLISLRDSSPFKDVRVRQAVNYALDKESMNANLFRGLASPASQPATPSTYGFNPNVTAYPYDPAKAKALLAEAGYPNGFKTAMEGVMGGSQTADTEVYQQIGLDLARVGIQVDVISVRFADWLKKWTTARPDGTVDFPDMFGLGYFVSPEMDAVRRYTQHWCEKTPKWYCNESLRPLIEVARTEFDSAKRLAALQQLMQLSHDDAPVLFTVNQIDVAGINKRVQNFRMVNRQIDFEAAALQ